MDEKSLSWRARLAKANINILDIHDHVAFVEFTYHPYPGGPFKWCKTAFPLKSNCMDDLGKYLIKEVLSLRKEMEG